MSKTKTGRIAELETVALQMGAVVELLAKAIGAGMPSDLAKIVKEAKSTRKRLQHAADERKRKLGGAEAARKAAKAAKELGGALNVITH